MNINDYEWNDALMHHVISIMMHECISGEYLASIWRVLHLNMILILSIIDM